MMIAEESTAWPKVTAAGRATAASASRHKWNMGWMHDTLGYMQRRPGAPPVAPPRAHLRAAVRVHRAVRAAAQPRRGRARQGLPARQDAGRRLAALRQPARAVRVDVGAARCAAAVHGRRDGAVHRVEREHRACRGTCSTTRRTAVCATCSPTLNRLQPTTWPALYERDHEPTGFQWLDADDADHSMYAFLRWGYAGGTAVACIANFTPVPRPGYRVGLPWARRVAAGRSTPTRPRSAAAASAATARRHAPLRTATADDRPGRASRRPRVDRRAAAARWCGWASSLARDADHAARDERMRQVRRPRASPSASPWACSRISFGVSSVGAGAIGGADVRDVAAGVHRRVAVLGRQRDRRRAARRRRRSAAPRCWRRATACTGWRWRRTCKGRLATRLVAAQLTIDESTAMAVAQDDPTHRRAAFWVTGLSVYVFWNLGTLIGALLGTAIDPRHVRPRRRLPRGVRGHAVPAAARAAARALAALIGARRVPGADPVRAGRCAHPVRRAGRARRRARAAAADAWQVAR